MGAHQHLTPEQIAAAPKAWVTNSAGIKRKVVDPSWLRREERLAKIRQGLEQQRARKAEREVRQQEAEMTAAEKVAEKVRVRQAEKAQIKRERERARGKISRLLKHYGISREDLVGPSTMTVHALPRMHAIYEVARLCPNLSDTAIAHMFNRKHNATVWQARRDWPEKARSLGIECKPIESRAVSAPIGR